MVGIRLLRFVSRLAVLLVVGGLVVARSSSAGSSNSEPLDYQSNPHSAKYDFSEVDAIVDVFLQAHADIHGATLAVVRRGESQIYEKGYGTFERDRVSFIASTGKMLTVVVILSLADEGLVDMDRPVAEYLDWGDHHAGVTLRNILSMMSGIAGESGSVYFDHPCENDPTLTLQGCAKTVFQDETLSQDPGVEFRYSGAAWQLAGAVAEIVTGRPWADLVDQYLSSPCGLNDTGYSNIGDTRSYPSDLDPRCPSATANPNLGGGASSTVNDYSKVLLMHLQGGLCGDLRVLTEASVQAMQEDLVPESAMGVRMGIRIWPPFWRQEAVNYGMGWWKFEDEPTLLIDTGAFGARAYLDPVEAWGAIVILEADSPDGEALRQTLVPAIRSVLVGAEL